MIFFQNSSVEDISENHVEDLLDLEKSEAQKILKTYKRIRRELVDRLSQMPMGSFTAQRLGGVLLQVDSGILALSDSLKKGMSESSRLASEKSINHLTKELNFWDKEFTGAVTPIDIDAVTTALDTDNLLLNKYEASIGAYSQAVRAGIAQGLTDAVIQEISLDEVIGRLNRYFQGEEWKLEQIARTELHNVYGVAKLKGMQEVSESYMPDLKKALWHPMDHRTGKDSKFVDSERTKDVKNLGSKPMKQLIVPLNEPFEYVWNGKKRTFMSPPDRPNDRSILVPYRESWNQ